MNNKPIICNYDNKQGHIMYKKNHAGIFEPVPCENQNICELNPKPSRYKKGLEIERKKRREWEKEHQRKYEEG